MQIIKLCLFLFFITFLGKSLFAQNYNVNILPSRIEYNKEYGLDLFLLFKYVELERKINKNFSVNLGIYYARQKEDFALSYFKSIYYNIDPSIRYYLNKKQKMNGFYFGSGFNYSHYNSISKGREASLDGSLSEINITYDFINLNVCTGYKLTLIKNRFSIDLKLNEQLNLHANKKQKVIESNGQINESNNRYDAKRLPYPYLDLKLGYRFGFKK